MLSYCTHSVNASLFFCFLFLWVLWTEVSFSVNMMIFKKDSSSEGITLEVKSCSHTVTCPIFLFDVKYALCILTTIKGIETFSTCATEICFIYPASLNISPSVGSGVIHVLLIHMSVSLLSMGESKTQQLLLNLRDVQMPLSTHGEPRISPHLHLIHCLSTSSYLFSMNVVSVKHMWPGQSDCFLFNSNVMVISECTCIIECVVTTRTRPH